ncbi:MAG: ThuA domain-containing protein [Planctomycetes bacterium]|nr:ThuA domain-containing protein [Planctomycetota bacterium]
MRSSRPALALARLVAWLVALPLAASPLAAQDAGAAHKADPAATATPDATATPAMPRVLFYTQSAGYVHDVVKRSAPDTLATAEAALVAMAEGRFDVVCSQDPTSLAAAGLDGWDAIVFYTTGELPLAPADKDALVAWVAHGGAFVGVHCAADTFYEYPPYLAMLGGTFDGHPWHEKVTLNVEAEDHPATRGLGARLSITDEIYQFRDFQRFPTDVLVSLDTGSIDASKGKRADGDYANTWCRPFGEGRVFYTALGHRPEVWADARFQHLLLGGIGWALDGPEHPARAPDGALVLVGPDGSDAAFGKRGGGDAGWKALPDGSLEVVPGAGDIVSHDTFGDALVHVEFMTPELDPSVTGQARGNSGVYVAGRYEVQVLDSYGLAPGMGDCAAIYGVEVPAVNACRRPGRWQSYDIRYTAPRFDAAGAKTADARLSVWHNGRLVHDDTDVPGPTAGGDAEAAADGPLLLQDHGNLVRYRNVWVLPLGG